MDNKSARKETARAGENAGNLHNWPRGIKEGFGNLRKYNPPEENLRPARCRVGVCFNLTPPLPLFEEMRHRDVQIKYIKPFFLCFLS